MPFAASWSAVDCFPIDDLLLCVRAQNAIENAGIETLGELCKCAPCDLEEIGAGPYLEEISAALASWRMTLSDKPRPKPKPKTVPKLRRTAISPKHRPKPPHPLPEPPPPQCAPRFEPPKPAPAPAAVIAAYAPPRAEPPKPSPAPRPNPGPQVPSKPGPRLPRWWESPGHDANRNLTWTPTGYRPVVEPEPEPPPKPATPPDADFEWYYVRNQWVQVPLTLFDHHYRSYPRMMFHPTKDPVTVNSQEERDALGEEWSRKVFAK